MHANERRAHRALALIYGYSERSLGPEGVVFGIPPAVEEWATDALCDLRHLADLCGGGWFDTWLDRSKLNHDEELADEAGGDPIPGAGQIDAALRGAGLEVETFNTGGGCMVTYAIATRSDEGWVDYVGVTHEEGWIIVAYHAGAVEEESAEAMVSHDVKASDTEAMAQAVVALVAAIKAGIRLVPVTPFTPNQEVS